MSSTLTIREDMTVQEVQEYVALQLQQASLNRRLRNLERIRKSLLQAMFAQIADTNILHYNASAAATHYSTTSPVRFRHIPIEYQHIPAGWLEGSAAVQSYFHLCQVYWKRSFRALPQSVFLDPATMSITVVSENDWEWRDGRRGVPWREVVECRQTYDEEFKIVKAEYLTLSGPHTHCWSKGAASGSVESSSPSVGSEEEEVQERMLEKSEIDALLFL